MISAIVCIDSNYGIGSKGDLLAHIPEDLKMFKELTTNNIVIMGRKTYESLPKKPLPNRTNIIITSQKEYYPYFEDIKNSPIYEDMESVKLYLSCFEKLKAIYDVNVRNKDVYIIGGGMIYKELLPFCKRIYITKILHTYDDVDTYFPNIDNMPEWKMISASEVKEYNGLEYQFYIYDNVNDNVNK